MCGIVGMYGVEAVNQALYDALTVLQHRGQDAAGIMTEDNDGHLHLRKDNGLVRDVFRTRHMRNLTGNIGIGHCRYPTAGSASSAEAQPFYVNSPYGISLAHNGNLTNTVELLDDLYRSDLRHINTSSDSEALLNVLAHHLQGAGKLIPEPDDFFEAVTEVHRRCKGAYAVVALVSGHGMLAFRDPNGIRPLVYGKREVEGGTDYMVASESVALSTAGFELIRDLEPGEALLVDKTGQLHTRVCAVDAELTPCLFEFVYLSRPDSVIDGISVYDARLNMGRKLAKTILEQLPDADQIDVVIPIPDTSRPIALETARTMGIDYREGFVKNRYIGRTFIMPGQTERKKSVRQKLNPVRHEFEGRNVLLVDDSIVRGTTSRQIVELARENGARKVYFASAAPPVRFPNVYGIDMPSRSELIAHDRTTAEIAEQLGADGLVYQTLDDLKDSVLECRRDIKGFDASVFDGHYVTPGIDLDYLAQLDARRNDSAKQSSDDEGEEQLAIRNGV
ncbi:amidophosphoribosyltransferase [Litorivicinus lipolyticus]|uniref:Amidophosphoribosyltransferase n=1 Tax=Litorivicinus lipolyticus TaxID=418701 RepID=A0A5Q2QFG1_9GAMM|nr:amidophosphoribosyltransferase [Litorivicinus lipolyticus]QGG79745.1 amidophosphoribosyltransferase [Litorivicinus lipolyticus]